jgi:CO/xanthine dehydrogenase Mo-binding subunit
VSKAATAPRSAEVAAFPRREFLKAGGALVIGFSMRGFLSGESHPAQAAAAIARGAIAGPPDPKQIDTWLAIHSDNTATVYIGYVELGQGSTTSLLQIAAEELDLDMTQVSTIRLDTNITPNQGGTYSSSSIARGSPAIRAAAAEARQALLGLASKKLNAPLEQLTVSRGIVGVKGAASGSATTLSISRSQALPRKNRSRTTSSSAKAPCATTSRKKSAANTSISSMSACPVWCMGVWCVRGARARMAPARK